MISSTIGIDGMRILVLVDTYLPVVNGTSLRTASLLKPLVRTKACEFHVATLQPSNMRSGTPSDPLPSSDIIDDVIIHRYRSMASLAADIGRLHRRHRFDLVHARGSRLASWALLTGALHHLPVLLELNYLFPQKPGLRSFLWRQTLQRVQRIITLSEAGRQWLIDNIGLDPNRVDVIINGIDAERFLPGSGHNVRSQLGLENSVVVGYLGTFWEWQGVLNLVKSAALVIPEHPEVRYLMVGDGPDLERTKELVHVMGLDHVFTFTGSVPPEQVPQYLDAMDIFVLARPRMLLNELAVPLKLLEAMAMQKAVVVTDLPALTEVVTDRVTGMVSGTEISSIASVISALVDNADLRRTLGMAARREVANRYSWDAAADQLLQSYRRALGTDAERKSRSK